MINETTAEGTRARLSDSRTLAVADYDPKGLESLETYVSPLGPFILFSSSQMI